MDVKEHLTKVRELLSDPRRWTKGTYARNEAGDQVHPQDPAATCFCIIGATRHIDGDARLAAHDHLRGRLRGSISAFNDAATTTHADVLKLLDEAIHDLA